jgi:hypothetical protein
MQILWEKIETNNNLNEKINSKSIFDELIDY